MILDKTSKCITDISEKVFFCYINKSYDRSIKKYKNIDLDKTTQEQIICDCACGAWKMAKKKRKHIEYVFAIYHAKVVGIFKVKEESIIHRTALLDKGYGFPEYPPKRKLEEQYSAELNGCDTEEQFKNHLDNLNNGLSFAEFKEEILEGQKFKNWKNTFFFNFDDNAVIPEEINEFYNKILLFPMPKNNTTAHKYRKIHQNEHYNFDDNGNMKNYL